MEEEGLLSVLCEKKVLFVCAYCSILLLVILLWNEREVGLREKEGQLYERPRVHKYLILASR
jgi:hypothetical protein